MFFHSKKLLVLAVLGIVVGVGFLLFSSRQERPVGVSPVALVEPEQTIHHEVIGTSVEGRAIDAYTYGDSPETDGARASKTHLVFVGGIHGGYEWNSVLLSYELMDYLEANPEVIPENITVIVIPSLNPDGAYEVIKKEGRFARADAPTSREATVPGRFNANGVDLNRNFGCKWQPESTWRGNVVSAGTEAFSEPEAKAFRDFVFSRGPDAAIFFHSQADAVYASECEEGILSETLEILKAYSDASGYKAVASFDAYPITGDVEGWLASIGIPALTVELSAHDAIEWEQNRAGVEALFSLYSKAK